MKLLTWLFVIALLLSGQTVRAEAILVDNSGSMGDSLHDSSTAPYPLRRIDVASRFLSYTFSNWELEESPTVLIWNKEPVSLAGNLGELAAYFSRFKGTPDGSTLLGKILSSEYRWASCEPLLVVTDKRPSDPDIFELLLADYLTKTAVTIVIVESVDAAKAYNYFSALSDVPHYLVRRIGDGSEQDVLLELMAMQRERLKELGSSCGLNA